MTQLQIPKVRVTVRVNEGVEVTVKAVTAMVMVDGDSSQ